MTQHKQEESFLSSYIQGEIAIGGWRLVGRVLEIASAFLVISQLDVFKYGTYILLFAFYKLVSGPFQMFLESVIFNDIVRHIAEKNEANAKRLFWERFALRMSIALVLSGGVLLGAELIAEWYDEDVAILLRLISTLFIISTLSTSMRVLFQAHRRFGAAAFRSIVQKGVRLFLLSILFVFFTIDIKTAVIATVIAAMATVVVFIPMFLKLYAPWRAVKAARTSVLIPIVKTYGKWSALGHVISSVTGNIRPWLIKFFINTEAVAIYSVAESLFGALKAFLPTDTLVTLIPREMHDIKRRERLFLRGTKYITALSIVFGIAGFVLVPPVVGVVFPQYTDSISLFLILLIALPFLSVESMASKFLVALRRQKFLFFVTVVKVISRLIFPITLLYFLGIWGMALERILMAVLIGAITFGYVVRHEISSFNWKSLFLFDAADWTFMKRFFRQAYAHIQSLLKKYSMWS